MRSLHFTILIVMIIDFISGCFIYAAEMEKTGKISGKIIDAETHAPLIGANISIKNSLRGAASDELGNFEISGVPAGNYVLQFDYIGYQRVIKTDIIVRPDRVTYVEAELRLSAIESDAITVYAGYFESEKEQTTGSIEFSGEEIRRAPGSAGDVSRIIMTLPSIAKVNDQSNNLIVRGGNPVENTFFVDNIEIPNINHFPNQGASGGPIGILNVDFIKDVSFYSGGFSALYGDKLSSVMDIRFREGSRSGFEGQLDLNFAGFGGIAEGPIGAKGSWILSIRRSYLDFVVDIFDVGSTVAPSYGDVQTKMAYDINSSNKLTLLGIFADDHNAPDRETAEENYMAHYGRQDLYQATAGINLRTLWEKAGYTNTSLAFTQNNYNEDFFETATGQYAVRNRSLEQIFKFRNMNHLRLNPKSSLEFGIDVKHLIEDYDNRYAAATNILGDTVPALTLRDKINADKLGVFINYILTPHTQLTANIGMRTDYFSYNDRINLSPRLSLSYRFSSKLSLNSAAGIYYQNSPLLLLAQNESNKNLKDPKAVHYVLGVDYLLRDDTKLTLEAYQKDYESFPMDPRQEGLFIIDQSFFDYYEYLTDEGKAFSRGVELTVQKKLAVDFYGLISASWFRSRYQGLDGVWRNRDFDNRITFSLEGGYKPNNKWEFSLRWIYAGGVPNTPVDTEASRKNHRLIYDENRINEQRYPDYHSMKIRFDRRFHFRKSNIVSYISVWNVYNRKNIASYFWNEKDHKVDEVYQWGLLPIFGLEYEF